MCGIGGIKFFDGTPVTSEWLTKMGHSIAHRGPDDQGIYVNNTLGFVHRRLSILDLSSNGHQPMHSEDGRYTIVFNGEIYNHAEFRDELLNKGVRLKSSSDTEVLLNLFILYGEQMLHRLNGMFAFVIYNNQNGELFMCRDRMGVKPLYYAHTAKLLAFASEPKAIFNAGIPKELDHDAVHEWFLYRYVSGEATLFKGIKKLLPGHCMYIDSNGTYKIKRWYHLGERIKNTSAISNPAEWFSETFKSSVKYRMVSDVPVGVLLSGGLDSSSVVASLHQSGFNDIQTFTIGFRNFADDESAIAAKFSEACGYRSHIVHLEDEILLKRLKQAIFHLDEPLVHQNDPQLIHVSSHASQYVKVLLSGEGADELMGGYVRYKTFRFIRYRYMIQTLLRLMPSSLKKGRINKLGQYLSGQNTDELIASNACNFFPKDLMELGIQYVGINNDYRKSVIDEAKIYFPNDRLRQLLYYDQHTYLQSLNDRNDRSTMASSIECREPFQDYRLAEGLGTMSTSYLTSGKKGKKVLVQSMQNLLPDYIKNFRKVGLSVPWLQLIRESPSLSSEWNSFIDTKETGVPLLDFIDRKKLVQEIDSGKSGMYKSLALQLFMFHLWQKDYLNS